MSERVRRGVSARVAAAITDLSAVEVIDSIAHGRFSAEELADAVMSAFERWAHLNAMIARDDAGLRTAARAYDGARAHTGRNRPLDGLPVVIKDNINTRTLPTSAATPALSDHRPQRDAEIVRVLVGAGALVAGKSNLHELAGAIDAAPLFGPVRNPYAPACAAGGSSGGSAAAVAARMVPVAVGTDTGGSVRIPAALCGIAGFRPSTGRYPTAGLVPISTSRDTPGVMARCVADLVLIDGVITRAKTTVAPVSLKGLRLGLPRLSFYARLDAPCVPVIESTLDRLRAAGADLIEIDPVGLPARAGALRDFLAEFEIGRDLPAYLKASNASVDLHGLIAGVRNAGMRKMLAARLDDAGLPEPLFRQRLGARQQALAQVYEDYFSHHRLAAMVFPTTPLAARPVEEACEVTLNGHHVSAFVYTENTSPGAGAGLPGLTLPVGLTETGLPVGLAIDAPRGHDPALLAISAAIENVLPPMPPPVTP